MTKQDQLEQLDKLEASDRQRLEDRRHRLQEEQRQLDLDWQRFTEEHNKRRKLIDALWSGDDDGKPQPRLNETQDAPAPQQEHSSSLNGTSDRSVSEEVRIFVDDWQDGLLITQSEVTKRFKEKYPAREISSLVSLVSHALSQLAKGEDRVLDLVEKGAGSRPSKYRKRVKVMNMGQ